jgi:hypothetical protein
MPNQIELCISCHPHTIPPSGRTDIFYEDNKHLPKGYIAKGTPYIQRNKTPDGNTHWQSERPEIKQILNELNTLPASTRRNIADLNQFYGTDMLLAISEFYNADIRPFQQTVRNYSCMTIAPALKRETSGLAGAAFTAMESKMSVFARTAMKYQKALEAIRLGYQNKIPGHQLIKLEQTAKELQNELNVKFKTEIEKYMSRSGRRGNAWTSSQRAINQAKSSRSSKPIQLSTTKEFKLIRSFERSANFAGKGIIILDAGLRVNHVRQDYYKGKDWQRTAVAETTGFGLGTATGIAVGSSVSTALMGIGLLATPVGWIFILGAGMAAGYAASKVGDQFGKSAATFVYNTSAETNWF